MLLLLYCLSQNPTFAESAKPLMAQLKNSEQMLGFLNDLSKFTQTFSSFQRQAEHAERKDDCKKETADGKRDDEGKYDGEGKRDGDELKKEKSSQPPTAGIANDFIQEILEGYLKKR